mgnify:CR=1 FL=1
MWKKVVAQTILVSLLWLVGSTITTYFIHQIYESHATVLRENVATIHAAWAMQDALWRLQVAVVEASSKETRETRIETAELQAVFETRLVEAEQSCYTAEEQILVKAAREHYSVYRDHVQERLRPQGLTERLLPQTAEKEKTIQLARAVAEPCRQLLELNERMLADATDRSSIFSTASGLSCRCFDRGLDGLGERGEREAAAEPVAEIGVGTAAQLLRGLHQRRENVHRTCAHHAATV